MGIKRAALDGVLTSTCLLANGPAFREAVEEVLPSCPDLGVGVHLNISDGPGMRRTKAVRNGLYSEDGFFRLSFGTLFRRRSDRSLLSAIEDEYRAQIELV